MRTKPNYTETVRYKSYVPDRLRFNVPAKYICIGDIFRYVAENSKYTINNQIQREFLYSLGVFKVRIEQLSDFNKKGIV